MSIQFPIETSALFHTDYDRVQASLGLQLAQIFPCEISHRRWPYPAPTPGTSALATDIVWLGPRQAKKVLVLISATHGVEGFCGSAIQRFLLSQISNGKLALPADTALLILHGLNAWGMAWARRCDERGVDLNRNFIDFNQPLPAPHPRYAEMLKLLDEKDINRRKQGLLRIKQSIGPVEYDRCLSGGQYSDSWAPFYGGTEASPGRLTVEAVIAEFRLAEKELVVLDLHTGLGPWGFGELISDHPADSAGERYAAQLFGAGVAMTARGASFSVPKLGLQDYHWHQLMQQSGCFITLEFGTYATENLFNVLIADHQHWRHSAPLNLHDEKWQAQRSDMLDHFCPQDKMWQQAVLFKSWQVCQRVFENWSQ